MFSILDARSVPWYCNSHPVSAERWTSVSPRSRRGRPSTELSNWSTSSQSTSPVSYFHANTSCHSAPTCSQTHYCSVKKEKFSHISHVQSDITCSVTYHMFSHISVSVPIFFNVTYSKSFRTWPFAFPQPRYNVWFSQTWLYCIFSYRKCVCGTGNVFW